MNKFETIMKIISDLTDDNTIIIIGVLIIAGISPENREMVLGGLIGALGMKAKMAIDRG
jgi:hypothetical protein